MPDKTRDLEECNSYHGTLMIGEWKQMGGLKHVMQYIDICENETHISENGTAGNGLKDWSTCCIWEDMGCTAEGGELKTFKHHLYSLFNHCQDFYLLF